MIAAVAHARMHKGGFLVNAGRARWLKASRWW